MTDIQQISFERTPWTVQHIRDAKNADDWPGDELHEVTIDPDDITLEGTPQGFRWLYDYLHYLKRAWRMDGEQTDAEVAEKMAEVLYDFVDDMPDERQRPKQVL
jgi:hypothetical protein